MINLIYVSRHFLSKALIQGLYDPVLSQPVAPPQTPVVDVFMLIFKNFKCRK